MKWYPARKELCRSVCTVSFWVYFEFFDLVVDYAVAYSKIPGCLKHVAPGLFQSVNDKFLFKPGHGLHKRQLVVCSSAFGSLQGRGQVVGTDDLLVAYKDGSFQAVSQFPDIARPVILDEQINGRGGDALYVFFIFPAEQLQEMIGHRQDVFAAFAQGRDENGKDIDPVI